MQQPKCQTCHRRADCTLRGLVDLTLPFAADACQRADGDWEREHAVGRALRGCGDSPGFVEDWILAGAMEQRDADALLRRIVASCRVDAADLTRACRHYVGPDLELLGEAA